MVMVKARDGVGLHVEETGNGTPIVFVHEFAGGPDSWEPQIRRFGREHRCIAFAARGYPPSEVPTDPAAYSQDIARDDVIAVMDALGVARAHVVGHSMGAYTALHVGLHYPERCLSLAALGCGWGSLSLGRAAARQMCAETAELFRSRPMAEAAATYARAPMRQTFLAKDPRGFAAFEAALAGHSGIGSALTMENLQALRPTLDDMEGDLARLRLPLLVIVGDEDHPCLDGSLMLKRTVPTAALCVLPRAGHTITLEEPAAVNAALAEFFAAVERGSWMAHRPPAEPAPAAVE